MHRLEDALLELGIGRLARGSRTRQHGGGWRAVACLVLRETPGVARVVAERRVVARI
jgi:hypothetical protein